MEVAMGDLSELDIGNTEESVQKFLHSQRELFHGQIDHLQNIVITQCKLTGVNPLSQEMAAGALSIKIGKRPRDLLNPKAVKYMQSVFSIKDAISKKETREISALFGVTATQVRDFFTSQRTRVRKVVRLSREKSIKSIDSQETQTGALTIFDPMTINDSVPLNTIGPTIIEEAPVPLSTNGPTIFEECQDPLRTVFPSTVEEAMIPLNTVPPISTEEAPVPFGKIIPTSVEEDPVPLNTVGPDSVKVVSSLSTQEEAPPDLEGQDKHFVENIFNSLRKEETFSGQVKLMEWILQIQNSVVLNWFLNKGGVMILATWLSQAAVEEQTSVLYVILKVLCHLPLHKCLPVHMSAVLQSVNGLRFYRTSDISNRARVLLSGWSKLFARSQAMKKPNGVKSSADVQKEIMLKQSISEVMADESWQLKMITPEQVFGLSYEKSENPRNTELPKGLKLLTASADDPNKKNIQGSRERRKVLLVEQPGQKSAVRSQQVTRAVPVNQSRPMSTDDIQKAKMRAQYMQTKHGKTGGEKIEGSKMPLTSNNNTKASASLLASKVHLKTQIEERQKPVPPPLKQLGSSNHPKPSLDPKEPLWKRCKRVQITWQTPPEVTINSQWGVGTGENSKEVEIQKNRNRREKETFYQTLQEIPQNPKNPWDIEMDYDDSLTPEIPTEQPPDTDATEDPSSPEYENRANVSSEAVSSQANGGGGGGVAAEPDLELLAVLLKNPDLVFALTSGQSGNISSEETVKLLDMIKSNGGGLLNGANGKAKVEERVEVSLPSPTPSSNPGTSGWRPEPLKNPFTQHNSISNTTTAYTSPAITTTAPSQPPPPQFHPSTIYEQQHFTTHDSYQNDPPNYPILHSPTPSTRNPPISSGPSISSYQSPHILDHMLPQYNREVQNPRQNPYNFSYRSSDQAARQMQPGPSLPTWDRNDYVDENRYNDSSQNIGRNHVPGQNRPQNFSGHHQDHGKHGNRWWPDHDRGY